MLLIINTGNLIMPIGIFSTSIGKWIISKQVLKFRNFNWNEYEI